MLEKYLKIVNIFQFILNLIIVIVKLPSHIKNRKIVKLNNKGTLNIIGNGPSLKDDYLKLISEKNSESDYMAVNSFAVTDMYEIIKPSYYVICDPAFFSDEVIDKFSALQNNVFTAINEKTKWNLTLFIHPNGQKHSPFISTMNNKNVSIHFINNIPIIDGSQKFNNFLFKYQLANPLFQNVLVAAIYIGIQLKYSTINIWGADHSWHEDFILGKDNIIYTPDKHFYDTEVNFTPHINAEGKPIKVYEEFTSLARVFKIYISLQLYSEYVNCKIINRSTKTWIDAFERN